MKICEYSENAVRFVVVELVLLLSERSISVSQECHEFASSERLSVTPTTRPNLELRILMVLPPLLHVWMSCTWPEVLLCSNASLSGRAAPYTDLVNWHPSQNDLLNNFHEQLLKTKVILKCQWKTILRLTWVYKKHINVLEGNGFLKRMLWMAQQTGKFSSHMKTIIDSQVLYYLIEKGKSGALRLWQLSQKNWRGMFGVPVTNCAHLGAIKG